MALSNLQLLAFGFANPAFAQNAMANEQIKSKEADDRRQLMEDERSRNAYADYFSQMGADPKLVDSIRGMSSATQRTIPNTFGAFGLTPYQEAQLELEREKAKTQRNNNAIGRAPSGYRYTPDGNLEPIPGGPADMKKQAATDKLAQGKNNFNNLIAEMRQSYNDLANEGGAVSTNDNFVSNAVNRAARSAPGEWLGGVLGTKEHSIVNKIQSARPLILNAIMQATGMSAKQLDSNTELKMYLDSLTNPANDYESNMANLDRLESMFGDKAKSDVGGLSDDELEAEIRRLQGGGGE